MNAIPYLLLTVIGLWMLVKVLLELTQCIFRPIVNTQSGLS